MANQSKQKGTAAETAVVNYLKANGFPYAERRTLSGSHDKGDVSGIPGVVIEVKNCAAMQLAQWVDEAVIEADNAGAPIGVVVHKRKGRGDPGAWYVTTDLTTFAEMLADERQTA